MRPNFTEKELAVLQKHGRVRSACGPALEIPRPHGESIKPHKAAVPVSKVGRSGVGSNPASPYNGYRSKLEAAWAAKLELEKRAGVIRGFCYEPFSLWLPGKVRYKPDFLTWTEHWDNVNGKSGCYKIELIEVKGWSKNRRDGMTRLKVAAALFPCFTWRLAEYHKGEWIEKVIQ